MKKNPQYALAGMSFVVISYAYQRITDSIARRVKEDPVIPRCFTSLTGFFPRLLDDLYDNLREELEITSIF